MALQRQRLSLIIGVVLALLAIFLIYIYIDQQRSAIKEKAAEELRKIQASSTSVLVATRDIPRGTGINPDDLEIKIMPNQFVQPRAVTSLDRIGGMVTIADISKGEQLTLTKLSQPRAGGGLAESTPVGKRAVTISVDYLSSLAGMVKPGDYVDLIAMVPVPVMTNEGKQVNQLASLPLFQNVLVLAVGQNTGGVVARSSAGRYSSSQSDSKPENVPPAITLALAPQEANLVSFIQEQGKFKLILRSPTDAKLELMQPASWDTVFQFLMPQRPEPPPPPKEEPVDYVEIYRGFEKKTVPLSKE